MINIKLLNKQEMLRYAIKFYNKMPFYMQMHYSLNWEIARDEFIDKMRGDK